MPRCMPATAVSTPEAAIHEYACPILRQYHIRTSRQLFHMDTEAKSLSVEILTHDLLWGSILASNAGHYI